MSAIRRVFAMLCSAQLAFFIALANVAAPAVAEGAESPPQWVTGRQLRSADGYANLEWRDKSGDASGLFLLTEHAEGLERSYYVEGSALTLLRPMPGDYSFVIQACARASDDAILCGPQSKGVTLSVAESAREKHAVPAESQDISVMQANTLELPSIQDFRPGLWYDPAQTGHGFSFYKVNHRADTASDPLHGAHFDLHGIWYTYEAKSVFNEPGAGSVPFNYQPVAARLKLVRIGTGRYSGGIYVTRNGREVEMGAATLEFGSDATRAQLDWSADFKLERRAGSESLELYLAPDPIDDHNISHFSGAWAPVNGQGYRLVEDIGTSNEAIQLLFEDAAGDMTWVQAGQGGEPRSDPSDFCFYYVQSGYAPGEQGTIRLSALGCDFDQLGASTNRNARRAFTGLSRLTAWVGIALPYNRGSLHFGSFYNPLSFTKTSNFHGIEFTAAANPCEIENGACSLDLGWFTDGYYPRASVFRFNPDTGDRRPVAEGMGLEVAGHPVSIEEPGRYVFELRMGDTADSSLIAESAELVVSQATLAAPTGLAVTWTDDDARRYRVDWNHAQPGDLARFELEETPPGETTSSVHLAAPTAYSAIHFDRLSGPFGLYRYRVRACRSDQSCSAWTASVDWQVDAPPEPEPEPELPPATPEAPPAPAPRPAFSVDSESVRAGATAGQFSVDAHGAANYRIALLTAPGSGGLARQLGLHYRSQGPNDSLGVGWTIDGLSAITRCPQTREQDAILSNRNILLNFEDRFCFDGQRLFAISGPYGGNGTEYRLEVDDNTRILSFGRAGSGPERFEVWHGDGSVSHFGNAPDSRIEARVPGDQLTVLSWALGRREDSSGNFIEYRYDERSSGPVESTLAAVRYTGNERAGIEPYAELRFHYSEGRTDVPKTWYLGGMASKKRLLTRIDSLAKARLADSNMAPLRSWFLHYGQDGFGRRVIQSIEECSDSARSHCFPPTRFDWLKHESVIGSTGRPVGDLFPRDFKGMDLADVNGDGRTDLLIISGRSRFYVQAALAQADGSFEPSSMRFALPGGSDSKQPVSLQVIDLDSDGRQDIIYPKQDSSGVHWVARQSNGAGFGSEFALSRDCCGLLDPGFAQVLDFNGDGRADLLTHTGRDSTGSEGQMVVLLNTTRPGESVSFAEPRGLLLDYSSGLFPDDPNDGWILEESTPRFATVIERNPRTVQAFDYDGDGDVDIVGRIARRYIRCDVNCLTLTSSAMSLAEGQTLSFEPLEVPDEDISIVAFFIVFESDGEGRYSQREVVALDAETGCDVAVACEPWSNLPQVRRLLQVEINGDGLADLAYRDSDDQWSYRLNTGAGFAPATPLDGPADAEQGEHARFVDISGDGFPEFVFPSATGDRSATWNVLANDLGSGFAAAETGNALFGDNQEGDSSILADFNGDGLTDNLFIDFRNGRVKSDTSRLYPGINRLDPADANALNALGSVTDGLGKKVGIEYGRLTDPGVHSALANATLVDWGMGSVVFDLVAPVSVVRRFEISAPVAGDSARSITTEFHYVGARVQAGGRGFLGFAEVVQYEPASGIRTNSRYRQDFPYTGLLADVLKEHVAPADGLLAHSLADPGTLPQWPDPDPANVSVGAILPGKTLAYTSKGWNSMGIPGSGRVARVLLAKKLEAVGSASGDIQLRSFEENQHDALGRLLRSVERTFAGDSNLADRTVTTENRFLGPDARWNLLRVSNIDVRHQRPGTSNIERHSAFAYDGQTGLKVLEITEPGDPRYRVETAYERDVFGNSTRTTVSAAGVPARTSRLSYDALGRFAVAEYNPFGQRVMQVHRWNRFGTPLEVSDIDGVITQSVADPMGRIFGHWTETGAWERTLHGVGPGTFCPAGTALHSWTSAGGNPGAGACLDVLQREIRSVREGFDGTLVFKDTRYDSLGRPYRVSEPYFEGDSAYWNVTTYDAAGRMLTVDAADGNDLAITHGKNACGPDHPLARTVVNGLGQSQTEIHNAMGEKVKVFDHDCGALTFSYDAIGNLLATRGADGATVEMSYDPVGRRTTVRDPDKGHWQYAWNALGELRRQLDAKGQAMEYEYDLMGRVVRRLEISGVSSLEDAVFTVEHEERTSWQNATASNARGKGQAIEVRYSDGANGETIHRKRFGYDDFGRAVQVVTEIRGLEYVQDTTYDRFGRVFQAFDASGDYRGLRHVYNASGYLARLVEAREGQDGVVYRDIRSMDARGNVSYAVLGNGVEAFASHDPASGRVQTLEAYDASGGELQFVEYRFDVLGNLVSRRDLSGSGDQTELLTYDQLNRLERVELTAPAHNIPVPTTTLALEYDAGGNILFKSDVGTYLYGQGSAGPHAVTSAGGQSYSYDANGNQVSGGGRTIGYSLFDKPIEIEKDGQSIRFDYGIAHERIMRRDASGVDGLKTTHYVGNVEYVDDGETVWFKRHVGGVSEVVFYPATAQSSTRYIVRDHLGSPHSFTDEEGRADKAVYLSFGAFGQRRAPSWKQPLGTAELALVNALSNRGFTGHEHADAMGLVHMNGRVYDPVLGRFLQADPMVQSPNNSQALNRYSYALNNPLSYTDPSGYFLKRFIKRWGRLIAAMIVSAILPGGQGILATAFHVNNVYAQAAITGFLAGAITAGSFKGAVIGSLTAMAVAGIVEAYNTAKFGKGLVSEAKLMPDDSTLQHLLGGGQQQSGLYRIKVGWNGEFKGVERIGIWQISEGDAIFTNGVMNDLAHAVKNGTIHLHQLGMLNSSYVLNYNPTQGFLTDLLEASRDIVGAHTGLTQSSLARNLAGVVDQLSANGVTGIQLVGHSQGGAITASALRFAQKSGMNLGALSGGGVSLNGAPVNAWLARERLGARFGVQVVSRHQFGDAVHVLGGLNLTNPLEVPIALLRAPALFSADPSINPHSMPCGNGTMLVCAH